MRTKEQQAFQRTILAWYAKHKRDLPWRKTSDPYSILVSEIMLQQTQVDRVIPKYIAFLKRFPSVQHLAHAKRSSVLKMWSGLGYNNRAVRLQQTAQVVVQKYGGTFPSTFDELKALPGLGAYTANAVLAFAFNQHVAAVDVNHTRVVRRVFFGMKNPPTKKIDVLSTTLVPRGSSYTWNHALMDFGAMVCKATPKCEVCPVQTLCSAYPTILTKSDRVKKTTESFSGSNRFFRGRIVAQLRTLPHGVAIQEPLLWEAINALHTILPERLHVLLLALAKDQVITVIQKGKRTRVALA